MTSGADRTREVLDLIDGALDDPRMSDDAVRWTPPGSPLRAAQAERTRQAIIARQQRRTAVVPPGYGEECEAVDAIRAVLAVDEETRERFRRVLDDLGEHAARIIAALRPHAEAQGKAVAALAQEWATALRAVNARETPSGLAPPAPTLRDADPRAYALQARRTRGTGPTHLAQREPAPRRLPARGRTRT